MTGFGGRSFEFMGQPGNTYSLISEKVHKVVHLTRSVLLHPCRPSATDMSIPSL